PERDSTIVASVFFFQAEDGIRDRNVTGVQTCALPISPLGEHPAGQLGPHGEGKALDAAPHPPQVQKPAPLRRRLDRGRRGRGAQIGRASCRERVWIWGDGGAVGMTSGDGGYGSEPKLH